MSNDDNRRDSKHLLRRAACWAVTASWLDPNDFEQAQADARALDVVAGFINENEMERITFQSYGKAGLHIEDMKNARVGIKPERNDELVVLHHAVMTAQGSGEKFVRVRADALSRLLTRAGVTE